MMVKEFMNLRKMDLKESSYFTIQQNQGKQDKE